MKIQKKINLSTNGQTLVTLLVFIVVALTVVSTSISIMLNVMQGSSRLEGSILATDVAESGIENALLRLLRDPSYTGETIPVGSGQALVTVTGTDPKTVNSVGTLGSYVKTIQATVTYTNNIMDVTSWREQY